MEDPVKRLKIILDCDPGHDDAVAILLAAKSPEIEILGITTVAGNQTLANTQRNARNVCQWLGLDIPVYAGCDRPLVRKQIVAGDIHGKTGLDGPKFPPTRKKLEAENAVNFLIRTLLNSEGDITIVTTGPMTNLALALRLEPKIAEKIERIVLMGGSIGVGNITPAAEFNIAADAEAAQICFTAERPITMIGLDVTRKVLCTPAVVDRMAKADNRASRLFVDLMGHYCQRQKEIFGLEGGPMYDPVTIAYLIDPDVISVRQMNVGIELCGQSYGRTNCDVFGYLGLPANADVAVDIDAVRFWDIIETGICRYGD